MPFKKFRVFLAFLVVLASMATAPVLSEAATTVTYTPAEISSVLNNPYMGWAPWADGGPYQQPHRLVYINVSWRDLEPTKGNYAFDALETKYKFNYWAQNGKKIIMRIHLDYPETTSHKDIPDWLYSEINGDGTWYDIDWGKGFSPNYNNTKLIAYHRTLISALAARYNNDKRVPIIALGSLGHWGEFHTKKSSTFTIPFPKVTVSDQYVQPYVDYFTNKILLMRRPFQIAKSNNMGLFNDSFGSQSQTYSYFVDWINNGYTDYLTGDKHPAMPDYWKTAPSGGEIADYPGLSYLQNSTIATSLQMVRDSHTSWLGPCSPGLQPIGTSLQNNFDQMLKTMGYRFVLQSVSHPSEVKTGSSLGVTMNWANKGVAPFYYNWPLELSLADSSGNIVSKTTTTEDIRTWLPGTKAVTQNLNIPSSLAAGTYTLCVGIIDPETNQPGIDLAISGRRSDGRYALSQITVTKPAEVTNIAISGQSSATIPPSAANTYTYAAAVKDQYGNTMSNQNVTWSLGAPVPGVSLDASTGVMTVAAGTATGTLTLKAVSASSPGIGSSKTVTLGLETSNASAIDISGATYVEIPKTGVTYSDYTASIKDQYSAPMTGESVTWSLGTAAAGVTLDSATGKITVGTTAIPNGITLKATSNTNGAVMTTKDLTLFSVPDPVATTIEVKGATYIKIPTSGVTYSDYTATVKDQNSAIMSGETVTWSLVTPVAGVTLNASNGKIVVNVGTAPGNMTLKATSNSNGSVTVTKDLILFTN